MGERPWIGVDLGGTSLLAAVVGEGGKVLGADKRRTMATLGAERVVERIAATIERALSRAGLGAHQVGGVGVGVPGPLDPAAGVVHSCPNLGPSWDNLPLAEMLSGLVGLPVMIENDVNAGAVGEFTYGAGRGARDLVALFVGTGLGGGLILDGRLRRGARNSAAEAGHIVLLADGPTCSCGQRGHAEALASRSAMERDIRAAVLGGRRSHITELVDLGSSAPLRAGAIQAAYAAGDAVVVEAVQRAQYYLGLLVATCVNLVDPDVVVVGGGVIERFGDAYLGPVRDIALQHYINKIRAKDVRVVAAALGDYSGAIGAAVVAAEHLT